MDQLRAVCRAGSQCPLARGSVQQVTSPCTSTDRLQSVLRRVFAHDQFRPGQLRACTAAIHGRDVFVRMATGAGKSLCMFLPPLAVSDKAMGVVIGPLTGLMDQQISQLRSAGVAAVQATHASYSDAIAGKFRFVFMSPECAVNPPWADLFWSQYGMKHIVLIAIDEAHCVVDWGEDFRTSFSRLGRLRAVSTAPVMALTATASHETERNISQSLHLTDTEVVSCSLNRPNIFLSVSVKKGCSVKITTFSTVMQKDLEGIATMLQCKPSSRILRMIVFTQTKNTACSLFRWLPQRAADRLSVGMYHANLTNATKRHQEKEFQRQSAGLRCIVATIAFGMGMDFRDVDLVIVYDVPNTMNQLHQLCGRAGRAGGSARAHIVYSPRLKNIDTAVQDFCSSKENCCRRIMFQAIGANESNPAGRPCCDICDVSLCPAALQFETFVTESTRKCKRRRAVRLVDGNCEKALKLALLKERDGYLEEHPGYRMLGANFVCPVCVIDKICSEARFVQAVEDLDMVVLRPELKNRFFNTIKDVLCDAPAPKRVRRV